MDKRSYTAKTRIARLSANDLVYLVNEAKALLRDARTREFEVRLHELRTRGYNATSSEDELARQATKYVDTAYPLEPHWYISERGSVAHSRDGSAEKVAPDILLPKRHTYLSLSTRAGGNSIEFTISRGGARIDIGSTDHMWFLMAKAWAEEALGRMTPHWSWVASQWLYIVLLLIGSATAMIGSSLLLATSMPTPLAIATSAIGLVLMAASGLLTSFPRSYIGPRRAPTRVGYVRVGLGYVIAGVIGWFIARIGDAVWPT